jgi:outer membrane lipoprotein SlyB
MTHIHYEKDIITTDANANVGANLGGNVGGNLGGNVGGATGTYVQSGATTTGTYAS